MKLPERLEAVSKFVLQSPPGEINEVINDVRAIIGNDSALKEGIAPSLKEYNITQFITTDVPGHQHQTIISEASRAPQQEGVEDDDDRFWDPRSRTSFRFDHFKLRATDPIPVDPEGDPEQFRAVLETAAQKYIAAHFHSGVAAVFSTPGNSELFVIQIVANKYNPKNYWAGRWRSEYTVDVEERKLEGKVFVDVHYYEQGNVQLHTTHHISLPLPPAIDAAENSSASKILALIELEEGKYQSSLNESYQELSEKTFKSLRRALPVTKSKLDWDKVLGYKLGAEITSASKGTLAGTA